MLGFVSAIPAASRSRPIACGLPDLHLEGRCKVGWVVTNVGQGSWDVWLEVSTGVVKLIRRANA